MTARAILAALALAVLAGPAPAAEIYIVVDRSTSKCAIVSEKPTKPSVRILSEGLTFPNRDEATKSVGHYAVCSSYVDDRPARASSVLMDSSGR